MHVRRFLRTPRGAGLPACLLVLTLILGCDAMPLPGDPNAARQDAEFLPGNMPPVRDRVEEEDAENDVFEAAQPATLPASGTIVIEGTINGINDVDLYSLGPAGVGERITIDVTGRDGLNTVAALFNGHSDLIDANDDRSFYGGLLDPRFSRVIRHETSTLFVGIAVSSGAHFASAEGRYDAGSYSIRITREPGAPVQPPHRQVVFMDFDGGQTTQIGLEPFTTMRPFSAESISDRFAGKTEEMINLIVARMEQDFAPYDVTLLNSRQHERPSEPHTTLYFGNFNAQYLGLADNVDTGNAIIEQEAIIYTEDISMFEGLLPSVEEASLAIANVGAHELGHLLGLEHSAEPTDAMATAASARQILEIDAGFLRSRMQRDVFPVGLQNEPTLLLWNVGANPNGSGARFRLDDYLPKARSSWRDEAGLLDIPIQPCGGCARVH